MARQRGSANFAGSLEVLAGAPLDARTVVNSLADLVAADSFPYKYIGMRVSVVEEETVYMLIGDDTTDISNWKNIGEGGGGGGTSNYNSLSNKPKINNVELSGNKSLHDLGIQAEMTIDSELSDSSENPVQNKIIKAALDEKADSDDIPTATSDLDNDSNFVVDANYVHTDNNYTTTEKTKLAGLENYDDTAIVSALDDKVDKISGKGLSENDYTDADKLIVDGVTSALADKVDKVSGKDLSTNDYTTEEKTKLGNIAAGAEVNVIEEVKVNGTALVPDANKAIDVIIPASAEYTIAETTTTTGYAKTYQLKKDNVFVGTKIDIPKDLVVSSGEVKSVTTTDVPYEGAVVGDKYIDLTLNDPNANHIYIPVKDLVDVYTAGDGINISNANVVSNTGVRAIATGSTNGTISVNTNGTAVDVPVYGLGSAAYKAETAFATSQNIASGDLNDYITPGIYSSTSGATITNKPDSSACFGLIVISNAFGGNYYTQLYFNGTDNKTYIRFNINNVWGNWFDFKYTDTTYEAATSSALGLVKPDNSTITVDGNGVISAAGPSSIAASAITTGTLGGKVQANGTSSATLSDAQVRDIIISSTDLTPGSSTLPAGTLYFVYNVS